LDLTERQRRLALDVVLVVEGAQLALGRPGLGGQPGCGRLRAAEGRTGEREAAEEVVPVAVGDQEALRDELRLLHERRQQLELVRVHGRVDDERLTTAAHRGARRLPHLARRDEDVGVQRDRSHGGD
jgi:hypothetical protein